MTNAEKQSSSSEETGQEKDAMSACYICGKHSAGSGELCRDCAGIVSKGLQLLFIGETAS